MSRRDTVRFCLDVTPSACFVSCIQAVCGVFSFLFARAVTMGYLGCRRRIGSGMRCGYDDKSSGGGVGVGHVDLSEGVVDVGADPLKQRHGVVGVGGR